MAVETNTIYSFKTLAPDRELPNNGGDTRGQGAPSTRRPLGCLDERSRNFQYPLRLGVPGVGQEFSLSTQPTGARRAPDLCSPTSTISGYVFVSTSGFFW